MGEDVKEVASITFYVYSDEEIKDLSVVKLDNPKRAGPGSVYDPRMGTTDDQEKCETCKESAQKCVGHFGHIELNEYIINPLYYEDVVNFLKCFCFKCSRLLILEDQVGLSKLNRFTGTARFSRLLKKLSKASVCCHCGEEQPADIKYSTTDNTISQVLIDKSQDRKMKVVVPMSSEDILKIFDLIVDCDITLLGFDPVIVNPKKLIMKSLLVLPPCGRPYVKQDGHICDDDLTNQYGEIIKANNTLITDDCIQSETKREKALQTLKFRISTLMNNSKGKAKHTTNSRPIKGFRERLTGKDGLIRSNLLGKRCDQSGRTVIGPDPTAKMDEVVIPRKMARILTVPERVTAYNIRNLTKIVNDGKANFVLKNEGKVRINLSKALYKSGTKLLRGDAIFRGTKEIEVKTGKETLKVGDHVKRGGKWEGPLDKRDLRYYTGGDFIQDLKIPEKVTYKLNIGDIVERHLQNGDILLLNRQPTLHAGSMQGMRVVVRKKKNTRINLSVTKAFNADFDGDEMNVHVPQDLEARAELEYLSSAQYRMISAQASKPNTCIVQDSLLAAYQMTRKDNTSLARPDDVKEEGKRSDSEIRFFNISMKVLDTCPDPLKKIQHIRKVLKSLGKKAQCYTGRGLISLILPEDFNYECYNKADPEEPTLKIYKGVLHEGALDKTVLGSTHNSIIQVIHKEYGSGRAMEFVDAIQFVTNEWLVHEGFTIGIRDCLVESNDSMVHIHDFVQKCFLEAESIKSSTSHPGIKEMRVNAALGKARDVGLRLATDALRKDNNLIRTVAAGSKGDAFNIAQITGLLGQQNLKGQRVPYMLNHGKRTMVQYPYECINAPMEYESKGFISSSFIKGLNPRECYMHAMSGRESCSDTAQGTWLSGYMQRRIIKLAEDLKVQYDGTVRDVGGSIYQMCYGSEGYDPTCTIRVGKDQEVCDVERLVTKLNMKYE